MMRQKREVLSIIFQLHGSYLPFIYMSQFNHFVRAQPFSGPWRDWVAEIKNDRRKEDRAVSQVVGTLEEVWLIL